jgi:2-haloacid dehalogenase
VTYTDQLKKTIKFCMFDQYGTVVDMQSGLTEIATPYLKSKGWEAIPIPSSRGGAGRIWRTR